MNLIAPLSGKQFDGYLRRRLPHELDGIVGSIVDAYRQGLPPLRMEMLGDMSARAAGVLSAYGERMAAIAVRNRSEEVLSQGLVAIGIADTALDDPRNNLLVLAVVNHSASMLGTDLERLLDGVAADLPRSALVNFRAFAARAATDKSLSAMGLGTSGSGETFRYVAGPTTGP